MAEWLRTHKDVKLPTKFQDMVGVIGLSYNVIKCYFNRRRKKEKENIKKLLRRYKNDIRRVIISYVEGHMLLDITIYFRDNNSKHFRVATAKQLQEELYGRK